MKPQYFEVLSPAEVQQIDAASMKILESVGLRVDLKRARDTFREAGARVDEEARSVRIPERLVRWAIEQAPTQFTLYGADPDFRMEIGTDQVNFAAPRHPDERSWIRRRASSGPRRSKTSETTSA